MFANLNIEPYDITKSKGSDPLTGVNPSPLNKISKNSNISFQRKENIKISNENKLIIVQGELKNEQPRPPEKPKPSVLISIYLSIFHLYIYHLCLYITMYIN
jgi:hypothetical protein